MAIRSLVTFEATGFPNEAKWTPAGSPLVPDGRLVAEALVKALREVGFEVSNPQQHLFYGWRFEIPFHNSLEWCLLQQPGPWLLLVREKRSVLHRLFHRTSGGELKRVLTALDRVLKLDSRFSSIQWFEEQAYDAGAKQGAETPL
ncbi:MAG: hypothetical protein PHU85_12750 [Phycisphaerae bacterium]|nr:hypothetical protein [Phycisphaerae bacterium]